MTVFDSENSSNSLAVNLCSPKLFSCCLLVLVCFFFNISGFLLLFKYCFAFRCTFLNNYIKIYFESLPLLPSYLSSLEPVFLFAFVFLWHCISLFKIYFLIGYTDPQTSYQTIPLT